ncbi:aldehyde dehydrogenase family protein [Ottowia thiooxydans]|uniref:aldehyde dehydrogenase family protein n=1 Tax=Ottowia thiooxydans TaxID=219182 RepID=UPI000424E470|nr:aldehyde dehydrogenase family protein [Ottowia thiooxydans]
MKAEKVETLGRQWIGGEWLEHGNDAVFASFNPANGNILGHAADADVRQVEAAIDAARQAFDTTTWSSSPRLRAQVLLRFAANVAARADGLARLLTAENGKPLAVARAEIRNCISELEYYAGLTRQIAGRSLQTSPGVHSLLQREASGVAAVITPWNAPAILLVRSLAPALAAGCTIVVKGARQTALVHTAMMECLAAVDELPHGVVNSFSESGHAGAQTLVRSPSVDVLAYTGSTAVGRQIMADGAQTLKRLCLELGGKAPCIVFGDVDVRATATAVARAATALAGQLCTAASRVLVDVRIADAFRDALTESLDSIVVGDGFDPATQMGPLIDQASCERMERLCDEASRHGEVLLPVRRLPGQDERGAFLRPGLVAVQDLSAPGAGEEVFGPLLNFETFTDAQDAIHRANFHPFGLAASVWSRDVGRAQAVAQRVRAGTVWINTHNIVLPEVEMGGLRDSGFGLQHGVDGLDLFLQTRHIYREDVA